jgi:hypothetical protein
MSATGTGARNSGANASPSWRVRGEDDISWEVVFAVTAAEQAEVCRTAKLHAVINQRPDAGLLAGVPKSPESLVYAKSQRSPRVRFDALCRSQPASSNHRVI